MAFRMRPLACFAAVLAVLNIAGTIYAAVLGEPWHAAIHVGLTAAFGAWARRLGQRPLPAAGLETLETELDGVRQELLETREDLDFAERLLAERLEAERIARRPEGG
ncbi:MAG TPA: hypothetical protein VFT04_13045 [Gemmatimonadales bacterium]|nr:hypothetical protein [Gemmatimonadales bacterium]